MTDALDGDFQGHLPVRARASSTRATLTPALRRRGTAGRARRCCSSHGNPTWSYLWRRPLAELSADGPPLRRLRPHGLRPLGQAAAAGRLLARAPRRERAGRDRRARPARRHAGAHDWGGPIGLGALLERRERLRALVLMNTWAWELPSFLPPFLREFRTEGLGEILALGGNLFVESIPGGMHRRDSDPVMMEAYRAPFPDYWSRAGDARLPARDPAHRARPQRAADGLDPRAAAAPRRARCCSSGACATRSSSRSSSTSGASCSRRPRRSSSRTPPTSWWRTSPTR